MNPTADHASTRPEPYQFTDDDGDLLHIGIPATPANGSAAISFYTPTEPVHVPVEHINEVIDHLRRLVAQQRTA